MNKQVSSTPNTVDSTAALTINYIGFVYRTLVNEGIDGAELLDSTGLAEADLYNADFRCVFAQHKRFVLNAIAATGDPHLGVRMGRRFNPLNIGLPASAAISSDVFLTALKVLQQFVSLNFSIVRFDSYEEDGSLYQCCQPAIDVGEIEYFVVSSSLAVSESFFRLLLNEAPIVSRAEFTMAAPEGWEAVSESLGIPFHFDAPDNRILLPKRFLQQPLVGTDPVMHQHMLRLCESQMASAGVASGSKVAARIRDLIVQRHYLNLPIDRAAEALGLSERSLRRQLSQNGTTYKKLVDELRQARARELLAIASLPISTIAYDLGFSDPSNFARSFKRWLGVSPQEYRESIIGQN